MTELRAPFPWFGGKRRVADVVWRAFGHDVPNYAWKAARGYAGEDNENRARERIWFSPHCLPIERQPSLFEALR